jgi:hypothetical protein
VKEAGMKADEVIQKSVDALYEAFGHPGLQDERKKILSKLQEAEYNLGNIRALADCIVAVLLAAKNQGFTVQMVLDELERVCRDSLGRKWKRMPDGTFQAF